MVTKLPGRAGKVRVTFALPSTIWADTVHLVGDFNDWNERATSLRLTETAWMITLELDAGREFQYRYLLNGNEWHNDWHADGYAPSVHGGDNSLVVTPSFADEEVAIGGPPERVITFSPAPRRQVPAS